MPLENQNPELLRRQRQQRVELKDNFYRQEGFQQTVTDTSLQMLERKRELRSRLIGKIPEGPLPQSGEALARIRPSYAERKKLKAEKKAVKSVLDQSLKSMKAGQEAHQAMQLYARQEDIATEKEVEKLEAAQRKLLKENLKLIQEKEKMLLNSASSEEKRLEIQLDCQRCV